MTGPAGSAAEGFGRTLALAILARLPLAATGLLLVIAVHDRGSTYGVGGLCSGACAAGMALGGPIVGRLIDRLGQTRILLLSGTVSVAAIAAFALLPAAAPAGALVVIALAIGLGQPPVPSCARAIWRATLGARGFDRVVTLDASLQELAFMAGPLLLVGAAGAFGSRAALGVTAVLLAAITSAFALLPEARAMRGAAKDDPWLSLGPLRHAGLRAAVGVAAAVGAMFGATEIGVVVAAGEYHHKGLTGALLALWGLGSIVTGLLAARRPSARPLERRIVLLSLVLAVASAGLALTPALGWLAAGLVLAGAAVAPLMAALYAVVPGLVEHGRLTEAFTLQTSGMMAGVAIGSGLGGAIAGAHGPAAAFAAAAAAALLAALWGLRLPASGSRLCPAD